MVCGKLCDNEHDLSNVQVAVTRTEEREELSLQDMDGVFLRVPVLKEYHQLLVEKFQFQS